MKTLSFKSLSFIFLALSFFLFASLNAYSNEFLACNNPEFPGCKAAGRDALKVVIVIDESGSITDLQKQKVKEAIKSFATTLASKATAPKQFMLSLVAFNSQARTLFPFSDVKASNFNSQINNVVNSFQFRGGNTIFTSALGQLQTMGDIDLVYFISDGQTSESTNNVSTLACSLKNKGTFIFGVVLSDQNNSVSTSLMQALTGKRELKNNSTQIENADWMKENYNGFKSCMESLAAAAVDDTPPSITCPTNKKVNLNINPSATGKAQATDNCGNNLTINHEDVITEGDCDWQCKIERTWTAMDKRGNQSDCKQIIEKGNASSIEKALKEGPIVFGYSSTTLTLDERSAKCILQWLPASGDRPSGLKRGKQLITNCRPGTNPLDAAGKLTNPLLAEAIKLSLYLRLHPDFGQTKLADLKVGLTPILKQNLSKTPDVNDFMELGNKALGNLVMAPHLKDLLAAFVEINANLVLSN